MSGKGRVSVRLEGDTAPRYFLSLGSIMNFHTPSDVKRHVTKGHREREMHFCILDTKSKKRCRAAAFSHSLKIPISNFNLRRNK